jgi:ankyrin repeat protein
MIVSGAFLHSFRTPWAQFQNLMLSMKLPQYIIGRHSGSVHKQIKGPDFRITDLLCPSSESTGLHTIENLTPILSNSNVPLVLRSPHHYLPKTRTESLDAPAHEVVCVSTRMTGPDLLKLLVGTVSNNLETHKSIQFVMELTGDESYRALLINLLDQKLATISAFAEKLLVPASREGKWDLVKAMIESGVGVDTESDDPYSSESPGTALQYALDQESIEMFAYIIKRGAKNFSATFVASYGGSQTFFRGTIVDLAVQRGHGIQLLQDASFSTHRLPNFTTYHLRNAIILGHIEMVQSLLNTSSVIREAVRAAPWLFYEAAVVCKNEDQARSLVDVLLSYDFAIASTDDLGRGSILAAASAVPHMAMIRRLLAAGFSTSCVALGTTNRDNCSCGPSIYAETLQDIAGRTALHVAVSRGHEDLVKLMINHGADTNQWCGSYPIQQAAWTGSIAIATLLVRGGADVNLKRNSNHFLSPPYPEYMQMWPALLLALWQGHIKTAEILHSAGAFLVDDHIEEDFCHFEIFWCLVNEGSQALILSVMGQLLIHQNLASKHADILARRFGEGFLDDLTHTGVQIVRLPGIYALLARHSKSVHGQEACEDSGEDGSSSSQSDQSEDLEELEDSLEHEVSQSIAQEGGLSLRHGLRVLSLASRFGLECTVSLLLRAGLNPFEPIAKPEDEMMVDIDDRFDLWPRDSAFSLALKHFDKNLARIFLDWDSSALSDSENLHRYQEICRAYLWVLHIEEDETWLGDLLAERGVDIVVAKQTLGTDYVNKCLYGKLRGKIELRSYHAMDKILRQHKLCGDLVHAPEPGVGSTPLQLLVRDNENQHVRTLLDLGADVNAKADDLQGATALQFAAMNGNFKIVHMLLEAGADLNAPCAAYDGRTAIEGAAEWGRLDMVHHLLEVGANIELCTNYRRTVYRAVKNGHHTIARMVHNWKKEKYGEGNWESPESVLKSMTRLELYGELPAISILDEDLNYAAGSFRLDPISEYRFQRRLRQQQRQVIEEDWEYKQGKLPD